MYFLDVVNELSQGGKRFSTVKSALIREESHHTQDISFDDDDDGGFRAETTTLVALHSSYVSENSVNRAPVVSNFNFAKFVPESTQIHWFYCAKTTNYYSFFW